MKHPRVTKRECEVRRCFTVHQHWLNSFLLHTQSRDDWKPEPELQWFIHPLPTISIISKHSSLLNVNIFFHLSLFLDIFIDSKDPWAPIDTEQGPHTLHILYRILKRAGRAVSPCTNKSTAANVSLQFDWPSASETTSQRVSQLLSYKTIHR